MTSRSTATVSTDAEHNSAQPSLHQLELHVVESSPRSLELRITARILPNNQGRVFHVAYTRSKSFVGFVSGSDLHNVLEYKMSSDNGNNLTGVMALIDGGYNDDNQISPERRMELMTVERYPLIVGEWTLPRQKHERPLRMDMIQGALQALISEP